MSNQLPYIKVRSFDEPDPVDNIINFSNKIDKLEADLEKEKQKNNRIDIISKLFTLTLPKAMVLVAIIHVSGWLLFAMLKA